MDAELPEGDVALRDHLLADGAPGGGVALSTATSPGLHEKLLTQPFLAEFASEGQLGILAPQGWNFVKKTQYSPEAIFMI